MIDNQRILFSEVWDRVEHQGNEKNKHVRVKAHNDIRMSKHIKKKHSRFLIVLPLRVSHSLANYMRSYLKNTRKYFHEPKASENTSVRESEMPPQYCTTSVIKLFIVH